jgi:RNase P subunit RPR2
MECTNCNSKPGEKARIEFLDTDKEIVLTLCNECYTEISEEKDIEVVYIDG